MKLQTVLEVLKELPIKCEIRQLIMIDNKIIVKLSLKSHLFQEFEEYLRNIYKRVKLNFVFNSNENEVEIQFEFRKIKL